MASFDGLRCKPLLACALATGLMAPAGALAWTKYTLVVMQSGKMFQKSTAEP